MTNQINKKIKTTFQEFMESKTPEQRKEYVDSDLENWLNAYYGTNEQKLRTIKTLYDPTNFFKFSQSIPSSD